MILITGANGTVGKEIVNELKSLTVDFKISSSKENTNDIYLNFEDSQSIRPALQGVKKLFLMRPPHLADKKFFEPVIACALEVAVAVKS